MNRWTRIFLVLLRLAIGWHFLIEGLEKIHSAQLGPTTTNRPWTSEGYLREATGPLAAYFRELAGDTDESVADRLTLRPSPTGIDPEGSARNRFPPALEAEWDALFQKLIQQPDRTEEQRKQAQKVLEQQKYLTARWLFKGEKAVKKVFPSGTVEVKETTPQRVEDFRRKLAELRNLQNSEMLKFEGDVAKARLASIKADVRRQRAELLDDLKEQTERMKTEIQKALGLEGKPLPVEEHTWRDWSHLEWIDCSVRWGLTIVGACLLAGLFTRTACLGGAAFLLMFFLAMPPFPGVPDNPRAEGHYLYINKNTIEMLALLALATTPSGKWFGLDGLVQYLFPWNWRKKKPSDTTEL
jgi:uncharacterized membrane protein YphA (DoxX/SURF4 family)